MTLRIECVLQCNNHLGEGPVWDVEEGRLYWVDGTGRRVGKPSLWRLDPRTGKVENWSLDRDIGAMALRKGGGAVLALDDGFYFYDFNKSKLDLIQLVDQDQPRTRLNDGKCDRRGRFYAGGMDDKEELAICGLYRLAPTFASPRWIAASSVPMGHAGVRTIARSILPIRFRANTGPTISTSKPARSRTSACSHPSKTIRAW